LHGGDARLQALNRRGDILSPRAVTPAEGFATVPGNHDRLATDVKTLGGYRILARVNPGENQVVVLLGGLPKGRQEVSA